MADVKISALPAASVPLAGTELVPIVQSGVTEQVTIADLTAGRTVSASTVLVGTTTQRTIAGQTAEFLIERPAAARAALVRNTNDANGPLVFTAKSRGAANGSYTLVASGDALGTWNFAGSDGTADVVAASIRADVDGTPGTNDMPGRLVFSTTADGASSPTERMRIDSTGAIGVGVTPVTQNGFTVTRNIGGSAFSAGIVSDGRVQTTASSRADYFLAAMRTSGSVPIIVGYQAQQATHTGTLTDQVGFRADASLIGATNNFGFFGNIPAGANRWNFYAGGTANNYFAGNVGVGNLTPLNKLDVNGSFGRGAPVTKTGNFTLADTENWIICSGAGSITVTFPAASSWTGREVMIKTIAAQTVVSASSNVVPLAGGAAGTAILPASAGAWVTLVSDGTNWVIMQS